MSSQNQSNPDVYDDSQSIYRINPRNHVRLRPGMYIGGTDKRALHHMIWEVLDNSIEEAMVDRCSAVLIQLFPDRTVCVSDNSDGLPVNPSFEDKHVSVVERIMTHYSHKPAFDGQYYGVSGGLHGVGLWAVNTLSAFCEVEIKRDGFLWRQTYSEGLLTSSLEKLRKLENEEFTGTRIMFTPDFSVLDENDFDFELVAHRCQELAFLHPRLKFVIQDRRETEQELTFEYPNGLLDWINIQSKNEITIHAPVILQYQTVLQSQNFLSYTVGLDLAFQYVEGSHTIERSFINSVPIAEGGSHLVGLKDGLLKSLSSDTLQLDKQTIMHGLIVAINLRHPDPQFGSPTKITLINVDVQILIEEAIEALFAAHPEAKAAIQAHFSQR